MVYLSVRAPCLPWKMPYCKNNIKIIIITQVCLLLAVCRGCSSGCGGEWSLRHCWEDCKRTSGQERNSSIRPWSCAEGIAAEAQVIHVHTERHAANLHIWAFFFNLLAFFPFLVHSQTEGPSASSSGMDMVEMIHTYSVARQVAILLLYCHASVYKYKYQTHPWSLDSQSINSSINLTIQVIFFFFF